MSTRPVLLVAVLAAIAVAVVAFVAATRGGTDPVLGSTPDFTFRIAKATGTSAVEGSKEREFDDAAMAAATRVEPVLATLYAEAFLDPENSSRGIYDAVWTVFDADALPDAQAAIETLTLGTLGPGFDDVEPGDGVLRARVFFDVNGEPALLAADVVFTATATSGDAAPATIVSRGEYLLRESGGLWRIVAFRVDRADEGLPAPSASDAA